MYQEVFAQLSDVLYSKYVKNIKSSKSYVSPCLICCFPHLLLRFCTPLTVPTLTAISREASKIHAKLDEESQTLLKHLHAQSTTIVDQAQSHHKTLSERSQNVRVLLLSQPLASPFPLSYFIALAPCWLSSLSNWLHA